MVCRDGNGQEQPEHRTQMAVLPKLITDEQLIMHGLLTLEMDFATDSSVQLSVTNWANFTVGKKTFPLKRTSWPLSSGGDASSLKSLP